MRKEFGQNLEVAIYGESHSAEISVVIKGLPVGARFSVEELQRFMDRRAPGRKGKDSVTDAATTARKEPDRVLFTEGVSAAEEGTVVVESDPVQACIRNQDQRSGDYAKLREVLRPGHADLGAYLKYGAEGLRPGGGRFSGRMTAPMCIAGGIAKQLLEQQNVYIHAAYQEIGGETDEEKIAEALAAASRDGDSIGGIVRCTVSGFPGGIGGPLYEGLEGVIAQSVFAIPAVKGIEFGSGFSGSRMRGSENNDPIVLKDGTLRTLTNHSGGINGGISNGMDIDFRVAFKPTPTISKEQRTVNIREMKECKLEAGGRHDACVVPRAIPVVEAAAALALYDAMRGECNE